MLFVVLLSSWNTLFVPKLLNWHSVFYFFFIFLLAREIFSPPFCAKVYFLHCSRPVPNLIHVDLKWHQLYWRFKVWKKKYANIRVEFVLFVCFSFISRLQNCFVCQCGFVVNCPLRFIDHLQHHHHSVFCLSLSAVVCLCVFVKVCNTTAKIGSCKTEAVEPMLLPSVIIADTGEYYQLSHTRFPPPLSLCISLWLSYSLCVFGYYILSTFEGGHSFRPYKCLVTFFPTRKAHSILCDVYCMPISSLNVRWLNTTVMELGNDRKVKVYHNLPVSLLSLCSACEGEMEGGILSH